MKDFLSEAFTTALGLVFVLFGIAADALTLRQEHHSDVMLCIWAAIAVFGALIISPQKAGGALKTAIDAAKQILPFRNGGGSSPPGGNT